MKKNEDAIREKKWILKCTDGDEEKSAIYDIARELGINPIIAKLLYSRGYTDSLRAKKFIYMETETLCDPFSMKDMREGIERLHRAVKNGEKIAVYGDYDVDGVTAVCTLYLYLKSKGANVSYYIPNRAGEGYGVSKSAIDTLRARGATLIVTVDTGITANVEVEYARESGIDFVVTDHHECHAELPAACAVINPHRLDCQYPFKELAGVGVVFKLISAYEETYEHLSSSEAAMRIFETYADLAAIGTIADVMPINEENRLIVSYGLKKIEETERPGLAALIRAASTRVDSAKNEKKRRKTKITSGFIGYTIAPRINAAGRIRSAELAVELFLAEDAESAEKIAEELCTANKERQAEENKIMLEAYQKIDAINVDDYPVIVLDSDDWHHGVIGIVSSRITEKYSRPSILISFKQNDAESANAEIGKGSGRSIKGLNLVEALCYCSDKLVKFGGHELAAGLSVERAQLKSFRDKINEYARKNLTEDDMLPSIEADCEIAFSDIVLSFAEQLQMLEPYGVGNPVPCFVVREVYVNEITPISDRKHTKFVLGDGVNTVTAMYFSNSPDSLGVMTGDKIDVLFTVDINEWLGKRSVQLIVKDIKPSKSVSDALALQRMRYEEIHSGAVFNEEENVFPDRDDFASLYRFIVAAVRSGRDAFSHTELVSLLSRRSEGRAINYIKLKIMIKVFAELNIVGIDEYEAESYRFKIYYTTTKTDLEKSHILKKLRQQKRKTDLR